MNFLEPFAFKRVLAFFIICLLSCWCYGVDKKSTDEQTDTAEKSIEVKSIDESKDLIALDKGKADGIKKNQAYCFFDAKNKKVACGKVAGFKDNLAQVKVSKTKLAKIKVGMRVKELKQNDPRSVKGSSMAFGASVHMPIMPNVTYNNLSFIRFEKKDPTELTTLWQNEGKSSVSLIDMGAFFSIYNLTLGGHFLEKFVAFSASSDFLTDDADNYVIVNASDSSIGFYGDYYFLKLLDKSLKIGGGIDFEMNTLTFDAIKNNDSTEVVTPLISVKSSLNVVSLRVPISYQIGFSSIMISGGGVITLPLMAMGPTGDPSVDELTLEDALSPDIGGAAVDLKKQLAHGKSSLGFQMVFGLGYML